MSDHPEQVGTYPSRCALCDGPARWRLERQGDVVLTWACPDHLVLVLADFLPTDKHRDAAMLIDLANTWRSERATR